MGRFFGEDEDRVGAAATVVLGHEYWVRAFASDRSVLGRTLEIGGVAHWPLIARAEPRLELA